MVSSVCGGNQVRSTKTSVSCLHSSMVVVVSWSGAAWVLLALGRYSSLRESWMPTCTVTWSTRSLTSISSVMSFWWTPCPRGLRQCWKIMVATQNIDTSGPIWTFSLRGILTFVASGSDINGCVLSYFEGTANVHCIQDVHSLLYIVAKCHFFSVVTWKYIIKYLQKCEMCTHFCEILYPWEKQWWSFN